MNKASLSIYIASAGAGKTHNLTREYLALALSKDFYSIQAVTFTNKATEEMKERIVQELYKISVEPIESSEVRRSSFFDELCQRLSYTPDELRERAQKTLRHILLNYGRFRVKTIDSFFQEVLRSFARELNLSGGFRLQLEADVSLEAAVVAVLAEQDKATKEHRVVQQWITQLAKELIVNGSGHNLKREIMKLAGELKREQVKQLSLEGGLPSQECLHRFKKHLAERERTLSNTLVDLGRDVMAMLDRVGLELDDVKYGKASGLSPFRRLSEAHKALKSIVQSSSASLLPKRFEDILNDPEQLFSRTSKSLRPFDPDHKIAELQSLGLWQTMQCYKDFVLQELPLLRSLYCVQDLLNSYGLLAEVDRKLKEQQRSAGSLLLADAPSLINAILSDGSGVQFIYEKLGVRLEHQMIDEFQDTSSLQYQNFKPLLEESLAGGNNNLIVGDLKQSIYRFRNSDSSLLATQVVSDFAGQCQTITLSENWRSAPEIVRFNNYLFGEVSAKLLADYIAWIEALGEGSERFDTQSAKDSAQAIERYYEGHEQSVPQSREGKRGVVAVHEYILTDKQEEEDELLESTTQGQLGDPLTYEDSMEVSLPRTVVELQKRGYRPCDIAILVRRKSEAAFVAQALEAYAERPEMLGSPYSLAIISSEALLISAAKSVRCVVAALEYILNPLSVQHEYLLLQSYRQMLGDTNATLNERELRQILEVGRLSLYEVIEGLLALWRTSVDEGELPYQIKLLDMALNFQSDLSADISDFLAMWYESGNKQTLTVPDDEHKIRLMTIHKSKGLGFPVVLLPFLTWGLVENHPGKQPILWCENPIGMQSEVAKVPVQFSGKLADTLFANDFLEEAVRMSLDALNLFYVASTRAKDELHLWIPNREMSDAKQLNKLYRSSSSKSHLPLSILDLVEPFIKEYQQGKKRGNDIYWIGVGQSSRELIELQESPVIQEKTKALHIEQLHVYTVGDRIEVLREGLQHFDRDNPRVYGTLMHTILSSIKTVQDIPTALLQAEHRGLFVGSDRVEYERKLTEWINSIDYRWFSPEAEVLREIPIIGGGILGSRRPDRVVLYSDGSVDIIDYKFGKRRQVYVRQIQMYQNLLRQMGYEVVRGYIWYVLLGEVVQL